MYFRPTNGRDLIPPELMTKSRWRRAGYRVRSDAIPRARAKIGMAWGGRARTCPLYAIEDTVAIKRRARQRRSWDDPDLEELEQLLERM
jgi:hypothetical protein